MPYLRKQTFLEYYYSNTTHDKSITIFQLPPLQDERQRRHEEKLAKEAAVEERKKALMAQKQARMQDIMERRRAKDAQVEQQRADRETERLEALRAKEK